MEKKKNGFIAISLIYSFFLVFLMTLLVIMTNYAHNRILLNDVKKTIKEQLNALSVIESYNLEKRVYNSKELIRYANEDWQVVKDNGNSVTLILNRNLEEQEMKASFETGFDVINHVYIKMCANKNPINFSGSYCYWENGSFQKYNWENSLVKKVVDDWFNNNELLQKAYTRGKLNNMNFSDGTGSDIYPTIYSSYIRILTAKELEYIKDSVSDIWLLDIDKNNNTGLNVKCLINKEIESCISYAGGNSKLVRPVIEVLKLK